MQDNGAQTAVQTIYRELDRARFLASRHAKQEEGHSDEGDDDWTMVDEEEVDLSHGEASFDRFEAISGMAKDASVTGPGTLALGSMVVASTREPESSWEV